MKQILGDNQFFGINHYDLDKGSKTKEMFSTDESVIEFIKNSLEIGFDGFMINSNNRGYKVVSDMTVSNLKEIHYSIPYPHKFASMVNENGMIHLFKYVLKNSSFSSLVLKAPQFIFTRDIKKLLPLLIDLEIPKNLPKGSYVYLQNIVTDLVLGIGRFDLLNEFCNVLINKGYKPGIITLNPLILDKVISKFAVDIQKKLIVCFNINKTGFNVFPSKMEIEKYVNTNHTYQKMGMSVLSSGGVNNIPKSLDYIKTLPLDYVVYGSSKIENLKSNYNYLTKV